MNGLSIEKIFKNRLKTNLFFSIFICLFLLIINLVFDKINYSLFIYILIISLSNLFGGLIYKSRCKV